MADVCDFIEAELNNPNNEENNILVHCKEGVSRSATVVIAYVMRKNHTDTNTTIAQVKEKRKVKPNRNFINQLRVWEATEYQIWQDNEETVPKEEHQSFLDDLAVVLKSKGLTGNEPIGPQNL